MAWRRREPDSALRTRRAKASFVYNHNDGVPDSREALVVVILHTVIKRCRLMVRQGL